MALRFDNNTEYLRRTASLPSTAAFTASGWCYIVSDLGSGVAQALFGIFGSVSTDSLFFLWNDSGDGLMRFGIFRNSPFGVNVNNPASRPAAGSWFYWFIRCSGTGANQFEIGWANAGATSFVKAATTMLTGLAMTEMRIGTANSDTACNAKHAALKIWDAALTDAELLAEMQTISPQRWTNLHLWSPCMDVTAANNLIDYSGAGKSWTAAGTHSVEDGPPVPYGSSPRVMGAIVTGGGGGGPLAIATTATAEAPSIADVTVTKPSGTVSGDLLLNLYHGRVTTFATYVRPSGFTLINSRQDTPPPGTYTHQSQTSWKIAGGSEPSNYTFDTTGGGTEVGTLDAMVRITGADPSSPINAYGSGSGTGTTITFPSVTTTVDNCLIVMFARSLHTTSPGAGFPSSVPSGTTSALSAYTADNTGSIGVCYAYKAVAGATTAYTVTAPTGVTYWQAFTIAITPGGENSFVSSQASSTPVSGLATAKTTQVSALILAAAAAALVRQIGHKVLANIAAVASLRRDLAKPARATSTPVASLTKGAAIPRILLASTTPFVAISHDRSVYRTLTIATSPAAALLVLSAKILRATTTPVASLIKAHAKTLRATSTPVATQAALRVKLAFAQATSTPLATLGAIKTNGRLLLASAAAAATLRLSTGKILRVSSTPAADLTKRLAKTISALAATTPAKFFSAFRTKRVSALASTTPTKQLQGTKFAYFDSGIYGRPYAVLRAGFGRVFGRTVSTHGKSRETVVGNGGTPGGSSSWTT